MAAAQPGVLHLRLERAYDLKDCDLLHKMVRSDPADPHNHHLATVTAAFKAYQTIVRPGMHRHGPEHSQDSLAGLGPAGVMHAGASAPGCLQGTGYCTRYCTFAAV
jgi:hypothetical protein